MSVSLRQQNENNRTTMCTEQILHFLSTTKIHHHNQYIPHQPPRTRVFRPSKHDNLLDPRTFSNQFLLPIEPWWMFRRSFCVHHHHHHHQRNRKLPCPPVHEAKSQRIYVLNYCPFSGDYLSNAILPMAMVAARRPLVQLVWSIFLDRTGDKIITQRHRFGTLGVLVVMVVRKLSGCRLHMKAVVMRLLVGK